MNTLSAYIDSSIGYWTIIQENDKICAIKHSKNAPKESNDSSELLSKATQELSEYFTGKRETFDWPLNFEAHSTFYQSVWNELLKIPFGKTSHYEQIAINLNNIKAIRAVGLANGRNPFPIVVPCHRIIGKDKSLTGYAFGLEMKRWLLEHEGALHKQISLF